MSDAKQAEQLWLKAHEHVKQGNLGQAVRDLSSCYEMLKALKDPRLAQVHRRWVDVHKLYQERKARAKAAQAAQGAAQPVQPAVTQQPAQQVAPQRTPQPAQPVAPQSTPQSTPQVAPQRAPQPSPQQASAPVAPVVPAAAKADEPVRVEPRFSQAEARTLGEQAEAAANAGNLDQAIALYTRVVDGHPTNELAKERIAELKAAAARKVEMSGAERRPAHFASTLPAGQVMVGAAASGPKTAGVVDDVAFLEQLLAQVQERRRAL